MGAMTITTKKDRNHKEMHGKPAYRGMPNHEGIPQKTNVT